MKAETERALEMCGRDRVYHNDTTKHVAINWTRPWDPNPSDEKWIVGKGATLDESGALAAREFASRLRAAGEKLSARANGIEGALAAQGSEKDGGE